MSEKCNYVVVQTLNY